MKTERKHATTKDFSDDFISVIDLKEICRKKSGKGKRFFLKDVSGSNWVGYDFELVYQELERKFYGDFSDMVWIDKRKIADSKQILITDGVNRVGGIGATSMCFSKNDVLEILN